MLLAAVQAPAATDRWHFDDVSRVVAVSDVHGAYDAMVRTLTNAGIVDESLQWSGGTAYLVITGDILDRGGDSRKVMDLIMRLEGEATAAGGQVHQLVGNHEIMNLVGDLRYVSAEEFAAFADDESAEERELWFQRFLARKAEDTNESNARLAFDKLAPPGFFGHRRALRSDGIYGKWLLDKPLIIVVNGTAFVHGGLPPYVAEHGLQGINDTLGSEVRRFVEALDELEDAGVLLPTDQYGEQDQILQKMAEIVPFEGPVKIAADTVIALTNSAIHDPGQSPLWYRGTVSCSELTEGDVLDAALKKIDANRVVIGHTPTITRRVLQRMNGRVIEIDTGMLSSAYQGIGNALSIEDDTLTVMNESGGPIYEPVKHPRAVGSRPDSIDEDALAKILQSGQIIAESPGEGNRTLVKIATDAGTLSAYFEPLPRKKGFVPELAAYRLDRLIGLDMVPVTVLREVNGVAGTMQFAPSSSLSEVERSASGRGASAWCELQKQWSSMYVFDALTYNDGRVPSFILYDPADWQLYIVEFDNAFGTQKGKPQYLNSVELNIGGHWSQALKGLSDRVLKAELGDVLDKRALSALSKRRDALIESAR